VVNSIFQIGQPQTLGAVGLEPVLASWPVFFGKMHTLGKKHTFTFFFSELGTLV
jgi:hypothetical protein